MDKTNFESAFYKEIYYYSISKMNIELKLEIIEKENLILKNIISEMYDKLNVYEKEKSNSGDLLNACIDSFKTFISIGTTMDAEIMIKLESAIKKTVGSDFVF